MCGVEVGRTPRLRKAQDNLMNQDEGFYQLPHTITYHMITYCPPQRHLVNSCSKEGSMLKSQQKQ